MKSIITKIILLLASCACVWASVGYRVGHVEGYKLLRTYAASSLYEV